MLKRTGFPCHGRYGSLLMATAVVGFVVGCADTPSEPRSDIERETVTTVASPGRLLRGVSGVPVPEPAMRAILTKMTRDVAVALKDPVVRSRVYDALRASPYAEQKLHFRRLLTGPSRDLLNHVAAAGRGTAAEVLARLDSLVDIEFYMPVPEHREKWQGGEDLIVVSSLMEYGEMAGFDLDGRPVRGLTENAPPATPVLVLVPAETDFGPERPVSYATCGDDCDPPCTGAGCGGCADGCPPPPPPRPTPGVWMVSSHILNLQESWVRGSPEIEVFLIGRTGTSGSGASHSVGGTAHEDASWSERRFDQDGHWWWAGSGSNGVLVAPETDIDFIKSQYPLGTPDDERPFTIAVWEDDHVRGAIYDPDRTYPSAVLATTSLLPAVQLGLIAGNPSTLAGVFFGAGFLVLLYDLNDLFNNPDDFIGIAVDKDEWYAATGQASQRSHVLVRGNQRAGEIDLVYRY